MQQSRVVYSTLGLCGATESLVEQVRELGGAV